MGKLLHWKETRTLTINPIVYKCTPNFAPRNIMMEQCNKQQAQKNFACTRRKLQHILKRHEKIESILQDVKHRLEPIHFLLAVADEKNSLDSYEEDRLKMGGFKRNSIFDRPISMELEHLRSPYTELKKLRVNQLGNIEKPSRSTINQLPNDDWKKILKDLNDWCMEMDPTDTLESLSIDTGAAGDLDLDTLDIPTSNFNY